MAVTTKQLRQATNAPESDQGGLESAVARFLESHRKPTLKSIAEITGLGVTTVSRALKDAPELAVETKHRVREIADRIGYRPDRAGVRLRTGKTNVVSLILNPHAEVTGYDSSVIQGVTEALQDTPLHLVVTPHFLSADVMAPVRYIVDTGAADGLIMSRTTPMDPRVRYLLEQDFPFVTHGRTELATPHPYYDFDNEAFARLGAERLVERGRRRLAVVGPSEALTFHHHMVRGFRDGAAGTEASASTLKGVDLDTPPTIVRQTIRNLALAGNAPDGLLCGGEISALAAIAGYEEAGLAVGEDVDVIAKQTSDLFDHSLPKIDTILEDLTETGLRLGKLLLRRLQGEPAKALRIVQAPYLRRRIN